MKATVEWKDGDAWRQANVELRLSKHGNQYFTHNNVLYVFGSFKEGTEVVSKVGSGSWVQRAGRITRNAVYLGEGLSWNESNEQKFKNEKTLPKLVFA
jgi:hypothetical protein